MERITRKEQKERTRQNLVAEATLLFARNGIAATTTADVARSLGLSHGTVFVHFPTREDLIQAVVDHFGERLSRELGDRLNPDLSLRPLLQAHLAVLSEFEDFYLRLIAESHSLPPGIRGQVYAMNASLSYRFHRAAQPLMKEGSVKKMDQASFFNSWMALLHYHVLNRDLFADRTPILGDRGDEILRLFFTLIRTTKGEK